MQIGLGLDTWQSAACATLCHRFNRESALSDTKIMQAALALLRLRGIHILNYCDVWLNPEQSEETSSQQPFMTFKRLGDTTRQ